MRPATTLTLREHHHRDALEEAVRAGAGDLAVGPPPRDWTGPVVPLGWEELVVVLPPADPLARRARTLSLDALADRAWVLFAPDHGLSDVIRYACARAGFTPRPAVRTGQVAAAAHLAAAGLGVAMVPSNVVPAGIDARRLRSPVARELVAYTRREWSPAALAFLDVLRARPWGRRSRNATVIE